MESSLAMDIVHDQAQLLYELDGFRQGDPTGCEH